AGRGDAIPVPRPPRGRRPVLPVSAPVRPSARASGRVLAAGVPRPAVASHAAAARSGRAALRGRGGRVPDGPRHGAPAGPGHEGGLRLRSVFGAGEAADVARLARLPQGAAFVQDSQEDQAASSPGTGWAFLVSVFHCVLGMPGLPTLSAHTLLGPGLSLLLVFRTNSAYQRFSEGRKIWNDILDISRDIVLSTSLYKRHVGRTRIKIVQKAVQAFPLAMQEHVRAKEFDNMLDQRRLEGMLRELEGRDPGPDQSIESSVPSANRPLRIVRRMLKTLQGIPNRAPLADFTNRERVWLLSMVNSLSHTVGRCERLVQTPVPLSYARHTSRFVSIWTLTLPLAIVSDLRWLTAPVILLITWALFGIMEIGHMIEDPFRASLELTPICR
ncbi:unnamed protein product, partial [Prorocentrum cordatum]